MSTSLTSLLYCSLFTLFSAPLVLFWILAIPSRACRIGFTYVELDQRIRACRIKSTYVELDLRIRACRIRSTHVESDLRIISSSSRCFCLLSPTVIVFVPVILQDPYDNIVDFASFGWLAKNQNSFWREIFCMYS